jgi:hypothetical protein
MSLQELSGDTIVYAKDYYNNSAHCILTPVTKTGKYRLYIDNWNTPKSPLVVQGIFVEVAIELNNRNLVSLNTTKNTRSTMDEPSFGIISCSGSIEFKDLDQQIQDYIENGLLKENLWCIIYLNNTLSKTQKQLDVKYTDKWNYDNDNRHYQKRRHAFWRLF